GWRIAPVVVTEFAASYVRPEAETPLAVNAVLSVVFASLALVILHWPFVPVRQEPEAPDVHRPRTVAFATGAPVVSTTIAVAVARQPLWYVALVPVKLLRWMLVAPP